jgi:hypothetical protein
MTSPDQQQPQPAQAGMVRVDLLRDVWAEFKEGMRINDRRRAADAMQAMDRLLGIDKFGNPRT